jgi:hypothetical protein
MKIEIENNIVDIYNNNSENPIYSFPKDALADAIYSNGNYISDWINQLIGQSWIDTPTLYELAKLIQQEFPNNNIDWDITYKMIDNSQ